jgi:hypothetical protein
MSLDDVSIGLQTGCTGIKNIDKQGWWKNGLEEMFMLYLPSSSILRVN